MDYKLEVDDLTAEEKKKVKEEFAKTRLKDRNCYPDSKDAVGHVHSGSISSSKVNATVHRLANRWYSGFTNY